MECWYKGVCDKYNTDCHKSCIRYTEMKYLVDSSGIPQNKQGGINLVAGEDYSAYCTLAKIKSNIDNFVHDGNNLYITSSKTGNGKTSWSIKLLMRYFDNVWAGNGLSVRGKFIYVPQLLLALKDFKNPVDNADKQNLLNCDLIVWDDIGSADISNYDMSQLLLYIDQRILNGKANIFTGNLNTKDKLCKSLGDRLASRIWNNSQIIEFVGKDKRNNGSTTNFI